MALPEVVSPQEKLKAVLFHNLSSQQRRRTSNGGNMAACPGITLRLPEHRVLEPARIAGPARQCRPFKTVHLSE